MSRNRNISLVVHIPTLRLLSNGSIPWEKFLEHDSVCVGALAAANSTRGLCIGVLLKYPSVDLKLLPQELQLSKCAGMRIQAGFRVLGGKRPWSFN